MHGEKLVGSPRIYVAIVVLVALLVVTAVLGGQGGVGSTGESLPPKQGVNRIAYVNPDGHIFTVSPDGSEERRISPEDGTFLWPTWSPDGRRLVFSGLIREGPRELRVSLIAFNTVTGRIRDIYVGDPGVVGVLAEGVLHYPLWSPDGSRLAFVVVTAGGLNLFLDDLGDSPDADFVMDRGPVWSSWSSDSRYLLVHRGAQHFLVNTHGEIEVNELDVRAREYRVPAWKPAGNTVTLLSEKGPGEYTLLTAEVVDDGLNAPQPITEVPANPAFLWSPDGKFLAVAGLPSAVTYLGLAMWDFQQLTVLPENRTRQPIQIPESVIAYFWSPDSTKLAYVTLSQTIGVLRWMILNTEDGSRWPLVDFIPSLDQLTVLRFFDQYAYSHQPWSPDSDSLVFSGRLSTEAITASFGSEGGAQGNQIVVLGAAPDSVPLVIAEGLIGFWSPR